MEETETDKEAHEFVRDRAIGKLALVVYALADERHDAKKHEGTFHKCADPICEIARDAYFAL